MRFKYRITKHEELLYPEGFRAHYTVEVRKFGFWVRESELILYGADCWHEERRFATVDQAMKHIRYLKKKKRRSRVIGYSQ